MKRKAQADLICRAAERARQRPEFLGWVLARYQEIEDLAEDAVRKHLCVAAGNWPGVQLCLRPRADTFLKDVTQVADEFQVNRATLAAVIRRVDAVEMLRTQAQPGRPGTLLAARTRKRKGRSTKRSRGDR